MFSHWYLYVSWRNGNAVLFRVGPVFRNFLSLGTFTTLDPVFNDAAGVGIHEDGWSS